MSIKAITVSPPSISLDLTPGETYSGEITILNPYDSTEDMFFDAEITPYSVVESNYAADFSSETAYNDIVDWITLSETTGVLAPGESKTLTYEISVPKTAHAGGQYATISVESLPSSSETVNESFAIASVIFASVDGDIVKSGETLEISTPSIVFTPPVKTTVTLKNSGNIHLDAQIETKITSVFSGKSIFTSEENVQTETVMPETTRSAVYTFDEFPELGLFNYSETVTYAGTTQTDSHLIFVCPIWFLTLLIATISAIIFLLISRIIKRNREKDV